MPAGVAAGLRFSDPIEPGVRVGRREPSRPGRDPASQLVARRPYVPMLGVLTLGDQEAAEEFRKSWHLNGSSRSA
jgi:hypothetical protein